MSNVFIVQRYFTVCEKCDRVVQNEGFRVKSVIGLFKMKGVGVPRETGTIEAGESGPDWSCSLWKGVNSDSIREVFEAAMG